MYNKLCLQYINKFCNMIIMSKMKKIFSLILIFFVTLLSVAFGYFMNNGMSFSYKSKAAESEGGARWTPSSYEEYKLDEKAVTDVMKKEADYVEKVGAYDDLTAVNQALQRDEDVDLSKYSKQMKTFGLKENDFTKQKKDIKIESPADKSKSVLGVSDLNIPQIGSRDVPSIAGGNVNKFTGTISHAYNFCIPAVRGNAGVSVGINYSSRTIDDLRTNKVGYEDVHPDFYNGRKCEGDYCYEYWDENIGAHTDSTTGLGWNLSSFGSITIDSDYGNEYVLSVGGQNVRIKQENGQTNISAMDRRGQRGAFFAGMTKRCDGI